MTKIVFLYIISCIKRSKYMSVSKMKGIMKALKTIDQIQRLDMMTFYVI